MRRFPMGFLLALRLFYHCALTLYKTVNNQTYAQKDERYAEKLAIFSAIDSSKPT